MPQIPLSGTLKTHRFQIVFRELYFLCVQTSRRAACSRVCHSAARSHTLSQAVLTATRRMRIASASSADAQWSARWDPAHHKQGSILRKEFIISIIVKNISKVLHILRFIQPLRNSSRELITLKKHFKNLKIFFFKKKNLKIGLFDIMNHLMNVIEKGPSEGNSQLAPNVASPEGAERASSGSGHIVQGLYMTHIF